MSGCANDDGPSRVRDSSPFLGIDIGGTTTKLGVVSRGGELVASLVVDTPRPRPDADAPGAGLDELVDIAYVGEGVSRLLESSGLFLSDISGVGIGMPMLVDDAGSITRCFNVRMDNTQMHESLRDLFGDLPCRIANDANAALMGECWRGAAAGFRSVVMLTLGTGVGGAIALDGKVLSGAHGAAGEFGHITVCDSESRCCACGRTGCLEQYASATALVNGTRRALEEGEGAGSLDLEALDVATICEAARAGDACARRQLDRLARALARGLAHLAATLDPELFVIGGGLVHHADLFMPQTRRLYAETVLDSCARTPIRIAALGNRAGMIGAASLVADIRG